MTKRMPLEGIRVADATTNWSGPYTTQLLASLGAEVIKVEAIQRLDLWRSAGTSGLIPQEREMIWEKSPIWNSVNTDKLDVTLDLGRARGAEIFKKLVKISDVVAENYSPRVMKSFGLDFSILKEVNPKIIMISLPAYGSTGPWKDYVGFAHPFEQMSGICQLTGYPDGPPQLSAWGLCDPISGVNGMAAVLIGLLYREMTGEGQYIDLSQVEASTCLIGDAIVDYTMNGRIQPRRGNRHPFMAPHGYYRCKGNDEWVSIAVSSDEEWRQLCKAIGDLPWTREERFAGGLSRWHNQDEIDKLIEEWTIQLDHYNVMNSLQHLGVAAGATLTSAEILTDPHIKERGIFEMVDRLIVGSHPCPIPSTAERLSKSPATIRRPAPLLGEHNEYVLKRLLGMSDEEVQQLIDDHIIGTAPLGV